MIIHRRAARGPHPLAGRVLSALVLLFAGLLVSVSGHAEDYPGKTVRIVIGTPPGDTADTMARNLATELGKMTGQAFFIDNRPGAHGIIAAENVQHAAADGYTLLLSTGGPMAINPSLYKKLPYDSLKSFEPIAPISRGGLFLVVNNALPVHDLGELVAYAKARPGALSYGSGGSGTTQHLAMETLKKVEGMDIVHVPYKGSPAVIQDLIGGQIQLAFDAGASILPQIQSGSVRLIGVADAARSPLVPGTPTLAEQGAQGVNAAVWSGLFAPAGTAPAIVAKLNELVNRALKDPQFVAQMRAQGGEPAGGSSEDFRVFLRDDIARWAAAVKASGATVD
jgi:tripartite-type tricarboxylate transporter receptor subunit TctC